MIVPAVVLLVMCSTGTARAFGAKPDLSPACKLGSLFLLLLFLLLLLPSLGECATRLRNQISMRYVYVLILLEALFLFLITLRTGGGRGGKGGGGKEGRGVGCTGLLFASLGDSSFMSRASVEDTGAAKPSHRHAGGFRFPRSVRLC